MNKEYYEKKWDAIQRDTRPADRPRVEAGVKRVYQEMIKLGLDVNPDPKIFWVDSPKEASEKLKQLYIDQKQEPENLSAFCYGQHDAFWLAEYDYERNELGKKEGTDITEGLMEIAEGGGWMLLRDDCCILVERPLIQNYDNQMRLHSLDDYAYLARNKKGIYCVHGVQVEEWMIREKEKITVEKIEAETNAEKRRIMVELYGEERYILDSKAEIVNQDDWGILYRKKMPEEDMLMVKMVNSTPEPDGSYRTYFQRVHPECRPILRGGNDPKFGEPQKLTALNAIASSYGLTGPQYAKTQVQT